MRILSIIGVLCAAAAGAVALAPTEPVHAAPPPADRPARQCFNTANVYGYSAPDSRTLYVRVGAKEVWRLDVFGTCPELEWSDRIALKARGTTTVCGPLDVDVIVLGRRPTGPERCAVTAVRRMTEAELAALPKRSRP